jgi:hypothetical protein
MSIDEHEVTGGLNSMGKFDAYRFYVVGKLIRQDMEGADIGYRESLTCVCHDELLRIIGPNRYPERRYRAWCVVGQTLQAQATTMEELWSVVERQREQRETQVTQIQLSMFK